MKNLWAITLSLALLFLFMAQAVVFVHANSQTYDEAAYLAAGYAHLRGDFTWMPEHPPLIKELCALPVAVRYALPFPAGMTEDGNRRLWIAGQQFLHAAPVPATDILALARLLNVFLGLLLVALVGWWSYRRWGLTGGLTGLALAAFEPNFIAHSGLVTTDVGVTLFGFASIYCLWEYVQRPRWFLVLLAGLLLGLAVVSKFSGLLTIVIMVPILLLTVADGSLRFPVGSRWLAGRTPVQRLLMAAALLGIIVLTAALVIPPVYRFQGYSSWLQGISFQSSRTGQQPAYLLGELSTRGWLGYFVIAFLLKTPLGTLTLLAASLLAVRCGTRLQRADVEFLLLPAFIILAAISWTRVDLGLRYVLPMYPFLLVTAARLGTLRPPIGWLTPLLVAATAISALAQAPQQLAYFQELCGGPSQGYRYLSDSNLDWGQDLLRLRAWQEAEGNPTIYLSCFGTAPPESYGVIYQLVPPTQVPVPTSTTTMVPEEGRQLFAISVVPWQGLYLPDPERFRWLRERTPVARPGHSMFIYDLTEDADAHWQLARIYRKTGHDDLARTELRKVQRLQPGHEGARRLLEAVGSPARQP